MNRFCRAALLFAGIAFLAACRKEGPVSSAALSSVVVITEEVRLTDGGTGTLRFFTYPEDVRFNYNVGSSGCCIFLGRTSSNFVLESVERMGEGVYEATLRDCGGVDAYSETSWLFYRDGGGSVMSNEFSVVRVYSENLQPYEMTGLPVMYIETEGGRSVTSKTTWRNATVRISAGGGYPGMDSRSCRIRGRGNTTWTWPKKPYSLNLDEKAPVLGMKSQKHWVLLANFMDRTLMRDALAFHIGQQTSLAWTPHCVYAELVLNGKHVGNYLITEQVRVDDDRVDIKEGTPGSWLFESDFHYDEQWQWRERNIPFNVKYPDSDAMTQDLFTQAKAFIKTMMDACYSGDYNRVQELMDVKSFADYWICFEVMGNHELKNPGSVFSHVSAGGLWTAGPIWDFDWGGLSYYTSPQAKTGLVNRNAVWYSGLNGMPEFRKLMAVRWKLLKPALESCVSFIDETAVLLKESDALNRAMWDPAGDATQNGGNIINGDERLSFEDAVARLRANYLERIKVMDSIIADGEY